MGKRTIKKLKLVETEVEIDVEELAALFCNLDNNEQAEFFNHVSKISESWEAQNALEEQMRGIADSTALSRRGKYVLGLLGDFIASREKPLKY
jgi:hypothetical protein